MMSQAAGYAATALGFVAAASGKPVLVKEIAEASDIPSPYLAKIVNTLARKGLLHTQRGIGGGVLLARAATEITLFDICIALDDPSTLPRCMLGTAVCSDERSCPAHHFWSNVREQYVKYLKERTVADIAAFELRRRTLKPATPAARAPAQTGGAAPLNELLNQAAMGGFKADPLG
jgi:Rrf2 family transcriptional regulator, iron-sulfur cluster assembly transcription factor